MGEFQTQAGQAQTSRNAELFCFMCEPLFVDRLKSLVNSMNI